MIGSGQPRLQVSVYSYYLKSSTARKSGAGHRPDILVFSEPLPNGAYKGKATDRKVVEEMKRNYYKVMGWDERGIPTKEILENFGHWDVDSSLRKLMK